MEQLKEYFSPEAARWIRIEYPLKDMEDLKERAIRVHRMKQKSSTYEILYFDKKGIFRSTKTNENHISFERDIVTAITKIKTFKYMSIGYIFKPHIKETTYSHAPKPPTKIGDIIINTTYFQWTISTLIVNKSTMNDFIERYNWLVNNKQDLKLLYDQFFQHYEKATVKTFTEKMIKQTDIQDLKSFIYKVERPIFEREPENKNVKTFDFARIAISVPPKDICPNRSEIIKKYQKEIIHIALSSIEESYKFQRFGVPINILRLTKMTLSQDDQLHFLFELKKLEGKND